MAEFLTQEWLDLQRKMAENQPERMGASARLQYVLTAAPAGEVRYYWVVADGKLVDSALGDLEDAEITLTLSWDDGVLIQKGELDASAAFMQGRVKVTGNTAKLMTLLPITQSPEYKQLMKDLNEVTEY
ncbi:MAG TPA: SCP2 sterol-binding domain-containing protein [Acidimicrobiales bacterium]|nr:SCP2 sterol-binding domain-containing protein [Acidimicrobiales bacterium]